MMVDLLKAMGAKVVVSVDLMQNRLDVATSMGATHTVNAEGLSREETVEQIREHVGGGPRDPTDGADVCIDMVGHQGGTLDICGDVAGAST